MSSSSSIIYKEMKDVPQEELKDLQGKIMSALSDITLSRKIQLEILTPLQALNFHCDKLMEKQYLFLKDTACFERLRTHLVSNLRSYLSQEDRLSTANRWENKIKVVYLDHIYREMTGILRYGRNPTLDECSNLFKINKETMQDILKDLRSIKSPDELKTFKPAILPYRKFAMDKHFHIKDIDNLMESKLSPYTEPGKSLNIGDEIFDCEYENFGTKFTRYIKRISIELYEYVYKPTNRSDFVCDLNYADYEELVAYSELDLKIFEHERPLTIATSKPTQSEFFSEPLSFESASLESVTPNPISLKPVSPKDLSSKPLSSETLSSKPLSSKPLSPEKLSSGILSSENLSPEKLSSGILSSENLSPEKLSSGILSSENLSPEKLSSGIVSSKKLSSEKLSSVTVSSEKLSSGKFSFGTTTLSLEKRIPKRKLIEPEESEKSVLIIQSTATQSITPKIFKCINLYPDDITHLKKGTISRPLHLTYEELGLLEGVKRHFLRVTEEISSIHYHGNLTYSYQYSERGLFDNDEIFDILREMGIFSVGNNDDFSLVSSDHMINKLSYVASLALGGKDGCQKLFKNSIDLFFSP
jgi:uncharacterized protein YjbI with pentapeptide repeats